MALHPNPRELALIETLALEAGRIGFLGRHLERLRAGALRLGWPWPPALSPGAVLAELARRAPSRAALRLELRRTRLTGSWRPRTAVPEEGVRLLAVDVAGEVPAAFRGLKTSERGDFERCRSRALATGAFDALRVDAVGRVLEGTIANVFACGEGRVRTPAVQEGCVAGVLRSAVLEELGGAVEVGGLWLGELLEAQEAVLTNAVLGVVPIRALVHAGGERRFPGKGGAWTKDLRARMRRRFGREAVAVATVGDRPSPDGFPVDKERFP